GDAAGIVVGVDEGRSVDAIAALPTDGERGIGFFDVDRFALPVSSQPCREPIGGGEQPGIAGFGGEQDQLTHGNDAAVMIGCPALDIAHLIGQTKTLALHNPLAWSTPDGFSTPSGPGGDCHGIVHPACSAICWPSSTTASTALSFTATSAGSRGPSRSCTFSVRWAAVQRAGKTSSARATATHRN